MRKVAAVVVFTMTVIAIVMFAALPASGADVGCDVGFYSQYIGGIGSVAGKHHEPVVQGSCRLTTKQSIYLEGWASQSVSDPGLSETSANEIDATIGIDKQINQKWSADLHLAYFDIVNDRLIQGTNGDLTNVGGYLRYHLTPNTKMYVNIEGYHGLGNRGLPGGVRSGLGMYTLLGPVIVNGILYNDHNFLGHGQYAKISITTKSLVAKLAGGELRPSVTFWQPLGHYKQDTHLVIGLSVTW